MLEQNNGKTYIITTLDLRLYVVSLTDGHLKTFKSMYKGKKYIYLEGNDRE